MIPPHCNGAEPQRDTIGQTERNSVRDGGQRPRPALRGRCGGGNGETFTAVGHRGSERTCASVHSVLQMVLILHIQQRALSCHSESLPVPICREQSRQSQQELYKFNTNPRGVCVIIDCVGNDGDMLEQTFKALHFDVILHKWLSVEETLSAFREIVRQREVLERADGFVCCIISRGTESHLLGTDLYNRGLGLDNVRRLFTAEACPMLAGKPKLFFIQRYSIQEYQPCARTYHRDEDLETDGCDGLARCQFIPTDADVFWSHCWTDEMNFSKETSSLLYLKALTDVLHKGQMRKTNLVDAHIEVNRAIFEHNKRNPGAMYHTI
ncbi:CASP8 and FADD-like apoptosis regulator Caspase-like protein [Larimichthys crocea]|uniref:CASP8 and FADD-like apoptosis regulator Caspase-like protein n=1 Tax=Larimichthys crocea TaxID=215358 RepID=A0A6G0J7H5_LARCR|nr:CASP8 and FADD-like apoptosis regulator Caspase-like protein [Larimichthys crocea]